jgi:hypothetical protein
MVPSSGGQTPGNGTKQSRTRVVRIYNGVGYFDDALAEQLRPVLAKTFPFAMTEPPKAASSATPTSPLPPETQKKAVPAHR